MSISDRGIVGSSGFLLNTSAPLDLKTRLTTAERLSLDQFTQAWLGMRVYDTDDNQRYELVGSDPSLVANRVFVGAGSGATVTPYTITGDGVTTVFTVNHGLGTTATQVEVIDPDSNNITVNTGIERPTVDDVVVSFTEAPANGKTFIITII